jgi:hypothetical protein
MNVLGALLVEAMKTRSAGVNQQPDSSQPINDMTAVEEC